MTRSALSLPTVVLCGKEARLHLDRCIPEWFVHVVKSAYFFQSSYLYAEARYPSVPASDRLQLVYLRCKVDTSALHCERNSSFVNANGVVELVFKNRFGDLESASGVGLFLFGSLDTLYNFEVGIPMKTMGRSPMLVHNERYSPALSRVKQVQ